MVQHSLHEFALMGVLAIHAMGALVQLEEKADYVDIDRTVSLALIGLHQC